MMSLCTQPASWYSLLNGHGFLGTNINPGQVYSFTHFSSMQLIQLGEKFIDMLSFHICIIPRTSQNQSRNAVGLLFVYLRFIKMFSNNFWDINPVSQNGATWTMSISAIDQKELQSAPSTVDIITEIPMQRISSPFVTGSPSILLFTFPITTLMTR